MIRVNVEEAAAFLRGHDNYIVYNHAHPDGDALGCASALVLILRALGKTAVAYSPDGIPKSLDFIPREGIFTDDPKMFPGFVALSVDTAANRLLGDIEAPLFALSFDHHLVNSIECERLCLMNDRCACGEIIFLLAEELGAALTKDIASALYTAICSDSGGFQYDLTSPSTHIMAAKLLGAGIDFAYINRRLFACRSVAQIKLLRLAYNKLRLIRGGLFATVTVSAEEAGECGAAQEDFDCLNSVPREIDGVAASAVIRAFGDKSKISLRSNEAIDVSAIANRFGGGGHFHAAGITLDCGVDEAEAIITKIFSELEI